MQPAHSTLKLTLSTLLILLAVTEGLSSQHDGQIVLDLTAPIPSEQQFGVLPGSSGGGTGGEPISPVSSLPLRIEMQSVSPQSVRLGQQIKIALLVTNIGNSDFFLPASRDTSSVLDQGNRGRKSFSFSLSMRNPKTGSEVDSIVATIAASKSKPKSWLQIKPNEKILVFLTGHLDPVESWIRAGVTTIEVRASAFEWSFEDSRYFIKDRTQTIQSANPVILRVSKPDVGIN